MPARRQLAVEHVRQELLDDRLAQQAMIAFDSGWLL
jgi:hypothetical protein